ncbi:MAG: aryl-sulfate sulfotransferase [Eubacteriales bacterium]|nr:aryl-sulfate sulfotransferase [Eubacteriales bacterium]
MDKKKRTGLIVALVIICVAAVAVFIKGTSMYRNTHQKLNDILAYTTPQTPAADQPSSKELTLIINNEAVTLNLTKANETYNCPTLNTEFDTVITTTDTSHEVSVNDQAMKDGALNLKLDSINSDTKITVDVDGTSFYLRTLPEDFPAVTPQGESSRDGYYYTTMGNYVVKFDSKGQVVFFRKANAKNAGPFRRNEIDGEVIYSYLEGRSSSTYVPLSEIGYRQTALILLDEQYQKIDEVPYMANTEKVPANYPLENHDYLILGKNHYILTTYAGRKVNNIPPTVEGYEYGANVVACIFQEVKDGECIFEWDSTDHPELYAASREAGDYTNDSRIWADYVHFNAVAVDPKDNNFICSYRNLDSIVKIDRETGEIIWVLGGDLDDFGLTEDQQFHRQHNVTVTDDGSILLFDNGCLTNVLGYPEMSSKEKAEGEASQVSRGLKLTLDEENMEVTAMKEYKVENFYAATMGSAQILDDSTDTVLLGWGGKSRTGMPLFQEVNCQDKVVNFELLCNDTDVNCYRVTYYDK